MIQRACAIQESVLYLHRTLWSKHCNGFAIHLQNIAYRLNFTDSTERDRGRYREKFHYKRLFILHKNIEANGENEQKLLESKNYLIYSVEYNISKPD